MRIFLIITLAVMALAACAPSKSRMSEFNNVAVKATDEADHAIADFGAHYSLKDSTEMMAMAARLRAVVDSCAEALADFDAHEAYGDFHTATMALMRHYQDYTATKLDSVIYYKLEYNRLRDVPLDFSQAGRQAREALQAQQMHCLNRSMKIDGEYRRVEADLINKMVKAQKEFARENEIELRGI